MQYLAGFFRTLQDTLARPGARCGGETPLVVLLAPGRFNESYFEHLYLARQLGYPLVEGSDLTVRDANALPRDPRRPRRVHCVLRRLDHDYCDPLELRTDSALGVPGLLEAVRQGNVLVANALGSGVLESPGLPGFLPAIAEKLLGEELLLPSIASGGAARRRCWTRRWTSSTSCWCAPASPRRSFAPVFARDLDEAQRSALAERIRSRPYAYVAQARAQLSQAPVWLAEEGGLASRAIGMRACSPWPVPKVTGCCPVA